MVSTSNREAWNEYMTHCVVRFTSLNHKRKRKEMENFPFLGSTLMFAFAFPFAFPSRLVTPVLNCVCVSVARVSQPAFSVGRIH